MVFKRTRIGKLRKFAVLKIVFVKSSELGSKKPLTKNALLKRVSFDIRCDGFETFSHGLEPLSVMASQRFAPGKSHQTRAITLFLVPAFAQFVKLHLGDAGKPAPKILPVGEGTELSGVRKAVIIRVG